MTRNTGIAAALPALHLATSILPGWIVKRLHDGSRGRLTLTFDDAPGPMLTPPVLDLLDRHRVTAVMRIIVVVQKTAR